MLGWRAGGIWHFDMLAPGLVQELGGIVEMFILEQFWCGWTGIVPSQMKAEFRLP